jgi:hypothetical protein
MILRYTVWKGNIGVGEKCLLNAAGDYVGVTSGTVYPAAAHRHSAQLDAQIVAVDETNCTGMYHLFREDENGDENRRSWKAQFIGCFVTVEEAHKLGDRKVYRCRELNEFFSETELKLL